MSIQQNLSIALRPKSFSEMIGNTDVREQLITQLSTGRVPAGFLFAGPSGYGKTTLAKILAISLNCEHSDQIGEPCEECRTQPERFHILERNAAFFSKVDDTRELLTESGLEFVPVLGRYRVVILDECQQMTEAAQNVILKPLEQENANNHVVFIFCTTDPQKLLKTVKGRLMSFTLRGLTDNEIGELVDRAAHAAAYSDDTAALIDALIANNFRGPRNVVMAAEKFFAGMPAEQAVLNEEGGKINVGFLCGAVIKGDWEACRSLLKEAEVADVDAIRMVLTGWLRKKLLESPTGTRARLIAQFIHELSVHTANTYEKGVTLSATVASIYRICQMVQDERMKKAA